MGGSTGTAGSCSAQGPTLSPGGPAPAGPCADQGPSQSEERGSVSAYTERRRTSELSQTLGGLLRQVSVPLPSGSP